MMNCGRLKINKIAQWTMYELANKAHVVRKSPSPDVLMLFQSIDGMIRQFYWMKAGKSMLLIKWTQKSQSLTVL